MCDAGERRVDGSGQQEAGAEGGRRVERQDDGQVGDGQERGPL